MPITPPPSLPKPIQLKQTALQSLPTDFRGPVRVLKPAWARRSLPLAWVPGGRDPLAHHAYLRLGREPWSTWISGQVEAVWAGWEEAGSGEAGQRREQEVRREVLEAAATLLGRTADPAGVVGVLQLTVNFSVTVDLTWAALSGRLGRVMQPWMVRRRLGGLDQLPQAQGWATLVPGYPVRRDYAAVTRHRGGTQDHQVANILRLGTVSLRELRGSALARLRLDWALPKAAG